MSWGSRRACSSMRRTCRRWRENGAVRPLDHRPAGRHHHGAVDHAHGPAAPGPRDRGQRLVLSRPVGDLAVASVEPAGGRREGLGSGEAARSGLHLRQAVLVVQHVLERRHRSHAAAHVPGGWPQAAGHPHASGRTSRRTAGRTGSVPAVPLLGPGRRHRIEPLDRAQRTARAGAAATDAHARLPAAPGLRPAAFRVRTTRASRRRSRPWMRCASRSSRRPERSARTWWCCPSTASPRCRVRCTSIVPCARPAGSRCGSNGGANNSMPGPPTLSPWPTTNSRTST